MDAGTNGTLYFDDFESRRFSYIGTLPDPGVNDPTATNQAGWFARTYQYSATIPHAVTSVNPETGSPDTYSYDANGNMTCRVEGGVTYSQTYNAENRISSIAKRSGDCTDSLREPSAGTILESWSFAYDGDGVRVMTAHFSGASGTPDSTTSYYMGGQFEVKDGTTKKYYSIAGMMVAVHDGTGLQYLLTDHLGSTVAVTNSSGTLTSQQRYLPFGAPRTIPNSPIAGTDFTFTGQRDLGDMGLMDYDARFYSQSLGRFIQPDTLIPSVAIPQTWNRYAYSINKPIKFVDLSGHFIETTFDILSIGMDIADIAQNGLNLANGAALVLDVASAVIPGVPALGGLILKASKAAKAVSTATDAAKIANKANDGIKTLFHATNSTGVKNILENGIDLTKGRLNLDFNPAGKSGFYMTELLDQATDWAKRMHGEDGRIIRFDIPKNKLDELSGKIFTSGDDEWLKFSLAGRNGTLQHNFDFVEGPFFAKKTNQPFGHQFAIFTRSYLKNGKLALKPEIGAGEWTLRMNNGQW